MEFRAGMFVYALAFLAGVVYVQQLAALPDHTSLIALSLSACLLSVLSGLVFKPGNLIFNKVYTLICVCIILFIAGYIYSILFAKQQLSYRIDESYAGKNLLLTGLVSSIPVVDGDVQRFEFKIDNYRVLSSKSESNADKQLSLLFPQKIRLSWHYGEQFTAAEKWQLEVRLKPPHGFMNPGGFDYEAWLFQHGIDATGYVRKSALNQLLQNSSRPGLMQAVNSTRQSLSQRIDSIAGKHQHSNGVDASDIGSFALVKALANGDKSSISRQQWQVLINTGTSHLMAISGLHIGLASLFAFVLIRWAVPAFVIKRIPAQHIAVSGGIIIALLYALMAGLSVSTQRAIIMLFVLSIMMLMRRNHRPVDSLGFALLLVLIIDPLAVLSAGFWFSFSAVAVIFISLNSNRDSSDVAPAVQQLKSLTVSLRTKLISTLKQWVRLQLLISVFLLPLSLFMFQQVSLISPLVNFLLIPYVSFLVVPLVLLALISSMLFPGAAEILFTLAAVLLDFVWPVLTYLSALPSALWVHGDVDSFRLITATIAIMLIFFSKRIVVLVAAKLFNQQYLLQVYFSLLIIVALLLVPIFIISPPQLKSGEYQLTVLDVGQGSAAVLKTQNHLMVFDTGAKFSDRLDAGSSVVVPYIRSLGVDSLNYLIISHGDADHIGGAQAIIDEYPAAEVIGQDIERLRAKNKISCYEGIHWHWDGVDFEFLSPTKGDLSLFSGDKRNNHSCVLRVHSHTGTTLFTGDIEEKVESRLLKKFGAQLTADILLVPHHGSKTSSSSGFITTVNPKITLFSVGYKNRYRFPHNDIMNRYSLLSTHLMQTDKTGAVTIRVSDHDGIVIEKYREKAEKYWHHNTRTN